MKKTLKKNEKSKKEKLFLSTKVSLKDTKKGKDIKALSKKRRKSKFDEDDEPIFIDADEVDEEEDDEEVKMQLFEELMETIEYKNEFLVLDIEENWIVVAKFVSIRINNVYNSSGFQPFDKTQEEKKCILALIVFGEDPNREDNLAYTLLKKGANVIRVKNKFEIESKLNSI
jgi:hypothetical protein